MACDRGRRDASGKAVADFIPVIAWERAAEFAYKWFSKGMMVAVDGRLQSRTYQAKDGTNRTAIEAVASNLNFCGSKADNAAIDGQTAMARLRRRGLQHRHMGRAQPMILPRLRMMETCRFNF